MRTGSLFASTAIVLGAAGCSGGGSYGSYEQYVRGRSQEVPGAVPQGVGNVLVDGRPCERIRWTVPAQTNWEGSSFTAEPVQSVAEDLVCATSSGDLTVQRGN